jgi:signal transduction histidine kinase
MSTISPLPSNEVQRLARLRALSILDTPPEPRFQRIVSIARRLFRTPMAAISLVDSDRQWFKAAEGLSVNQTARTDAFCSYTILRDTPLCVLDASNDPRFEHNPLVAGCEGFRFYAGAPIEVDGLKVGSLCVIDRRKREAGDMPTQDALATLADLASLAGDIMRQHEIEIAARAAEDAHHSFLNLLNHEVRTPASALLGYLDLLREEGVPESDRTAAVDGIDRNTRQLVALMDDLIELMQIETGAGRAAAIDVAPDAILRPLLRDFGERAAAKDVLLRLGSSVPPDFLVRSDPRRLRVVWAHLLANAVKFTSRGSITVRTWTERDTGQGAILAFEVADTGIGLVRSVEGGRTVALTETEIEELFQPFVRRDAGMARRYGGLGAGLPIARHIARLGGGDVRLRANQSGGTIATARVRVEIA